MNVFGTAKASINTREAAERYGVEVNRYGKELCPFHNDRHPFLLVPAIGVTCYAFAPVLLCSVICTFRFDAFLKTGACIALCTVIYYFANFVIDLLFGTNESSYQVNFADWGQNINGNILLISSVSLLAVGFAFTVIGVRRACKKRAR